VENHVQIKEMSPCVVWCVVVYSAGNLAMLEEEWDQRTTIDWAKINENASPEGQQAFDYLSNM